MNEVQQRQVDSLLIVVENDKLHDTIRVLSYFELANFHYLNEPLKAITFCEKAKKLSERNNYLSGMSESYGWLGYLYKNKGELSNGLSYNLKALDALNKLGNKRGIATSLNNIANIYDGLGDIKRGLEYYDRSLKIYQEINDQVGAAFALNNMGYVYQGQKDYENALKYYELSLSSLRQVPDTKKNNDYLRGSIQTMNNIGYIHKILGNAEKGRQAFQKGFELAEKIKDKNGQIVALVNVGITYYEEATQANSTLSRSQKDFLVAKADSCYQRSLILAEEIQSKKELCHSLNSLVTVAIYHNRLEDALEYGLRSMALSKEMGYPVNIRGAANYLSEIYEKKGDAKQALVMYKLYIQMRDSINNEETQKTAIRQQTQYEFEKEQIRKENEAKEQARVEAEQLKRRDNMEYSLIFLGILLFFGIVLMLGFVKVSPNVAEGLIFFAFLIFFEFLLVFVEPYLNNITEGEPIYTLLANAGIALLIFPLHDKLEELLKKRIVK